jgi:hypothetical protein
MTDDEIKRIYLQQTGFDLDSSDEDLLGFARAIEQASRRSALEEVAAQWDGCIYHGIGEDIDIGSSIRNLAKETNNG